MQGICYNQLWKKAYRDTEKMVALNRGTEPSVYHRYSFWRILRIRGGTDMSMVELIGLLGLLFTTFQLGYQAGKDSKK